MAYIYKIENLVNGKVYIGKTLDTIGSRWSEHIKESKKARHEKRPLYDAMKKYGIENFDICQVEECSSDIVSEREKFWIEYFGSYRNGYNATRGGDGTQYANYDLIYGLYLEGNTFEQIVAITSYDRKTIARALTQKGISKEERLKNNIAHISKAVAKLDPKTEEIIEVYESAAEAERHNGNTQHISDVCNGKRKTCKGFKWKYV